MPDQDKKYRCAERKECEYASTCGGVVTGQIIGLKTGFIIISPTHCLAHKKR